MIFYKNKSTRIYHTPGPDGTHTMCGVLYKDSTFTQVEAEHAPAGMACAGCYSRVAASHRTGKNYAQIKKSNRE